MILAFLFFPITKIDNVGGETLTLFYYIRASHSYDRYGDSQEWLGYLISLFGYLLIFIATFLKKGPFIIKRLSLTALVAPAMILTLIVSDHPHYNYTGAIVFCLMSFVFFLLCLAVKSNKQAGAVPEYDRSEDIAQHKWISICAYLGFLVLIPLFGARDSKFARFHTNQGLILFAGSLVWTCLKLILLHNLMEQRMANAPETGPSWELSVFSLVNLLISLFFIVMAVIGIVNVLRGRETRLPLIGKIRLLK